MWQSIRSPHKFISKLLKYGSLCLHLLTLSVCIYCCHFPNHSTLHFILNCFWIFLTIVHKDLQKQHITVIQITKQKHKEWLWLWKTTLQSRTLNSNYLGFNFCWICGIAPSHELLIIAPGLQSWNLKSCFKCSIDFTSLPCPWNKIMPLPSIITLTCPGCLWASGLSTRLQAGRLQVRFPVRAHAWVAGQVPIWGWTRGKQLMFLTLCFTLPSPLSENK